MMIDDFGWMIFGQELLFHKKIRCEECKKIKLLIYKLDLSDTGLNWTINPFYCCIKCLWKAKRKAKKEDKNEVE